MAVAYLVYMACRVAYLCENWGAFAAGWDNLDGWDLLKGGLTFDSSAIAYSLSAYVLMYLLPIGWQKKLWWQRTTKTMYVLPLAIAVVMNLSDAVYAQYTGRRTTATLFSEMGYAENAASIMVLETARHWYLVLLATVLTVGAALLYRRRTSADNRSLRLTSWLALAAYIPVAVIAMRGGASTAVRPITISNANQYVNQPSEAAIVLNTPFCILRTLGKTAYNAPGYYNDDELQQLYSPLHQPNPSAPKRNKNVVILIVESLGCEYIGAYNSYKGYTPFVDSLITQSLWFRHSFANGRKSIDAMPSVLSSIPMFVEPFVLTPYSLNEVSSIAEELAKVGYASAFFHGAENGSMGFEAYARSAGFQHYYGRSEYNADRRFGGDNDFDGTWAIWDEEFLQYYALTMGQMHEPFVTAVFTATSHHPFVVPQRYEKILHEEGHPILTTLRYADLALQRFFQTAQKQPWYNNTLFVITGDHTNVCSHTEYNNDLGRYRVPIILFDPSGELPIGPSNVVAQQIDIMPTVLDFLGYGNSYIAFGKNLLETEVNKDWALFYNNGNYQYVVGDTLTIWDGTQVRHSYLYPTDPCLKHDIGSQTEPAKAKAIIQSYMQRMRQDCLVIKKKQLSNNNNY